jgi:hypothetical protein
MYVCTIIINVFGWVYTRIPYRLNESTVCVCVCVYVFILILLLYSREHQKTEYPRIRRTNA